MSKLPKFNIGEVVAYSANFLHSTGQTIGVAGSRRGVIADFEGNRDWQLAVVEWSDGTMSRVNVHNLAKPGANTRFCRI